MQNQPYPSINGLTIDEQQFIDTIAKETANDNQDIDYEKRIKQAPTTDNKGVFWFELAEALSELPSNKSLDIRENGRLRVSLHILDELLKTNARFPQVWSHKIIVLK